MKLTIKSIQKYSYYQQNPSIFFLFEEEVVEIKLKLIRARLFISKLKIKKQSALEYLNVRRKKSEYSYEISNIY